MRKLLIMALAVVLTGSLFATPSANAQAGSASGSCGYVAGAYGLNSVGPMWPEQAGVDADRVHWQLQYSGVGVGVRLQVLRYPGSMMGADLGSAPSETAVTAAGPSGAFAASFAIGGETGATRFGKKGTTSNKSRSGKNGGTTSSGTAGSGMYVFQVWDGNNMIGSWNCAVANA